MKRKCTAFAVTVIFCFLATMLLGQTAFAMGSGTSLPNTVKCGDWHSTLGTPKSLKLLSKTDTTAVIKWQAPNSSRGINGYNIYRNNMLIGTSSGTTYTDTNLTPNTYYTWTVKAYDSSQRQSDSSNKLTAATQIIIRDEVTWTVDNTPASINGGLIVEEGAHLQIEPSVTVKIKPCQSVTVFGTVNAAGTADAMIVFTAANDGSSGGCGRESIGYWDTIQIASGGIFTGDYVKILYGSTLATVQGMLTLTNSEVAYAKTLGIFVDTLGEFDGINDKIHNCCTADKCRGIDAKGQVNLTSTEIYDCPGTGVLVEETGTFNGTSVSIRNCDKGVEIRGNIYFVLSGISACHYGLYFNTASYNGVILNSFLGNDQYGVYNNRPDDVTIDALMNYWGSPNGPSVFDEVTRTWSDGGDKVSKGVNYENWLTEPAE